MLGPALCCSRHTLPHAGGLPAPQQPVAVLGCAGLVHSCSSCILAASHRVTSKRQCRTVRSLHTRGQERLETQAGQKVAKCPRSVTEIPTTPSQPYGHYSSASALSSWHLGWEHPRTGLTPVHDLSGAGSVALVEVKHQGSRSVLPVRMLQHQARRHQPSPSQRAGLCSP